MNRNCSVCEIKIDKNNYLKDGTVCKSCYNKNRRKNNNNTPTPNKITTSHQQPKIENVNNNKNKNRSLIIGLSNCGISYLLNRILFQKREPFFIDTKSLNQYPYIKAQTSNEVRPSNEYENTTVVFHDMLLSKQESNIDLFFRRDRHINIDIYYISQSYFHRPKIIICSNSNINILYKQTLRDLISLFHDIAGLDMNLEE